LYVRIALKIYVSSLLFTGYYNKYCDKYYDKYFDKYYDVVELGRRLP